MANRRKLAIELAGEVKNRLLKLQLKLSQEFPGNVALVERFLVALRGVSDLEKLIALRGVEPVEPKRGVGRPPETREEKAAREKAVRWEKQLDNIRDLIKRKIVMPQSLIARIENPEARELAQLTWGEK